ncbi:cystathionine beta-lyase [Vibrio ponticus]|uniref:cysteine-S-conjugate beta-lyase n=1 Tax=Vibrio ponticus TaxID=265668 RepID=A0ABX3FTM5_9VIBR|nr:MalY/PatB family protein [Vibrio ponticus]OLQ95808.1 cystathionine beta-lyase [Vibrio ponticus]
MKYNFDNIVDRSGTDSMKWEHISMFYPKAQDDVLSMWVADMDFACAPQILDAIKQRTDRQILGYSHSSNEQFLDAVQGWFSRRFNWTVDKESIVYAPGIVPALGFLANILAEEGEGILIQRPVYYPFTRMIEKNNRKLVNNPLRYQNGDWFMDLDDLENKIVSENVKAIFFCSPHNPTGRVWTVTELEGFLSICKRHNLWVVSDEIHFDLIRKGIKHTPLELIDPSYKHRIITCTAPSKSFNLAGVQLSNIVINDEEMRNNWHEFMHGRFGLGDPNAFALVACQAAYNEAESWLNQVNEYIDGNFNFIREFINENNLKMRLVGGEGTYLAWIDMRAYNLTDEQLTELVLEKANIALDDGYIFGEEGTGFQRINVACPRSRVVQCMNSLKAAFSGL